MILTMHMCRKYCKYREILHAHIRFRFCVHGLSESAFCRFPNQIWGEIHRRSSLMFF